VRGQLQFHLMARLPSVLMMDLLQLENLQLEICSKKFVMQKNGLSVLNLVHLVSTLQLDLMIETFTYIKHQILN
jgi:hypothetical protein